MQKVFSICWWLCAAAALVPGWFFVVGLADGTVGAGNILQWMVLLVGIAAALLGSRYLFGKGRTRPAWLLLAVLLVPAVIALLIIAMLLVNPPHWQ